MKYTHLHQIHSNKLVNLTSRLQPVLAQGNSHSSSILHLIPIMLYKHLIHINTINLSIVCVHYILQQLHLLQIIQKDLPGKQKRWNLNNSSCTSYQEDHTHSYN